MIIYIYCHSKSRGLNIDAMIYKKFIPNSMIIYHLKEIDLNNDFGIIILENIVFCKEEYLKMASVVYYMVNIDLFRANNRLNKYVSVYLCKTKFTEDCLIRMMGRDYIKGAKTYYTRFTSFPENLYDLTYQKNFRCFLHSAGKSDLKNTRLVIDTWMQNKLPPIVITCYCKCLRKLNMQIDKKQLEKFNVTFLDKKVDFEKIKYLKNFCGVHICPSFKGRIWPLYK